MPRKAKTVTESKFDIRKHIIANATKTGKDEFPYTVMGFSLVQAALS